MKLRQANDCEKGFVERLSEQRLAITYANGTLITHPLAGCSQAVGRAHQSLETAFEVLTHVEPKLGINLQPLKNWGQILWDRTFLVLPDVSTGPKSYQGTHLKSKNLAFSGTSASPDFS